MNEAPRSSTFDVVIAGGGMVGSTLAIALAPLGLRIALVEAVARDAPSQPSFDERSTALSRSSQRLFDALGLWPEIAAAATPIRAIRISDRGRFGFSRIDADEQGVEALGYVAVNRVLGQVLQSAVAGCPGITTLCPARVVAADATSEGIDVGLDGDCTLTARLLVAADGARSGVRDLLGITATERDYGQQAIIGNVRPGVPHDNVAWERFTGDGPLALLPFGPDRAAFVWTVAARDAGRVLSLPDASFLAEFQERFGMRLGRFTAISERAAYPLRLSKALRIHGPRAVLVGNAAHGLHPVAAQGFNLGLRDVAALCDCVADAGDAGQDIGNSLVCERYADWRRSDQRKLVALTDGLVSVFGAPGTAGALRDIGMLGFDLVPGLRTEFARHAMGLAGRLPRLSRGVPVR